MNMVKIDFNRPSDSLFTHLFARSISVYLTPVIAKTAITPLQVTIIGLIIGLLAAYAGSYQGWAYGILTAFLIELSHIFDCVDGELARLTGKGNLFAACLDPISDRVKDIAIIYVACMQSIRMNIFHLTEFSIFSIAFFSIGFWFLYMYIVDAYLNPAREKMRQEEMMSKKTIYIGLYDLFVYGSIVLWLFNKPEYFIFFILFVSIMGLVIQLVRLRYYLKN